MVLGSLLVHSFRLELAIHVQNENQVFHFPVQRKMNHVPSNTSGYTLHWKCLDMRMWSIFSWKCINSATQRVQHDVAMNKRQVTLHIQKKALIRKLYTHCKIKLNFIQILNYYLHTHCHVQRKNQSWKHWNKQKSRCFSNWEATLYNSASECKWIQFLPLYHNFFNAL